MYVTFVIELRMWLVNYFRTLYCEWSHLLQVKSANMCLTVVEKSIDLCSYTSKAAKLHSLPLLHVIKLASVQMQANVTNKAIQHHFSGMYTKKKAR